MVEFVPDDCIIGIGKTGQLGKLATPMKFVLIGGTAASGDEWQ